ncbi:MAG: HAD-IIIC family phosphatase [Spirochaetales bacterium]|nr:HAD-IIIC family phosphatase [Spirochaetales bacterium]
MIKCVVFDLDNTLWDGIIAEDTSVTLKPQVKELLSSLDEKGILLSIASNSPFVLSSARLTDWGLFPLFLFPQCNDLPKREKLKAILEKLNLAQDTVLFIDDDPFALAEARYFFPDMTVWPASDYLQLWDLVHDPDRPLSNESKKRRETIQSGEKRKQALAGFKGSYEDFLSSLNQVLTVSHAKDTDLDRVHELASRTNRVNNFGLSIDRTKVESFFSDNGKKAYIGKLADEFGDYGTIGACLVEISESQAVLRLFCVSCRVEGRGMAVLFLKAVIQRVQKEFPGIKTILCSYRPAERNRKVVVLLKLLGFKAEGESDDGTLYSLSVPVAYRLPGYVEVREG